jgi:tetratricopeptide (TPR) repeat protein
MSYCPDCGAMQSPICVGCGTQISPEWTYCASCGRQLGADIDCRTGAAVRRRAEQLEERERTVAGPGPQPREANQASSAEEHNKAGTEFFEKEDFEGAIREYQAAVQLEPNNSAYHCNLGMAYDEADREDEALAEYQKTLELDPNDLTALLSIGYMYSENDQPDEAREAWNRVLQMAPDSAEAQEVRQNLRHQAEL